MTADWLIRGGTVVDGTGAPARRADVALAGDGLLGLPDRGGLRPGAAADVVILDPGVVADTATYQTPHRDPGISWVWVNGAAVLEDGRFDPHPAGRVLTLPR